MARGNCVSKPIIPQIAPAPTHSYVNDILLHALLARITLSNNDTIEFQTLFDNITGTIDLCYPDGAKAIFDQLTGLMRGPNLKKFIDWLIGSTTIVKLEDRFKSSTGYKELTYSESRLTNIDIYTDNTKSTKLFNKSLTYTNNMLTQTIITDIITNTNITKIFNYSGTQLVSITTTEVGES